MSIIYGDRTHAGVMELLRLTIGRPSDVLAQITASIVRDARERLDEVPDEAVVPVALEVLILLGEIAWAFELFHCDLDVLAEARERVLLKLTH